jgi:hypothetical protein
MQEMLREFKVDVCARFVALADTTNNVSLGSSPLLSESPSARPSGDNPMPSGGFVMAQCSVRLMQRCDANINLMIDDG